MPGQGDGSLYLMETSPGGPIADNKVVGRGKVPMMKPNASSFVIRFRERYFKLVGNLLFYFRINEYGAVENEALGVIVVENFIVNLESSASLPFAFEIHFLDEPDKRHIFTARTEVDVQQWVKTLRISSYQYWKDRFNLLTSMVHSARKKKMHNQSQNCLGSTTQLQIKPQAKTAHSIPKVESVKTDEDLIKW